VRAEVRGEEPGASATTPRLLGCRWRPERVRAGLRDGGCRRPLLVVPLRAVLLAGRGGRTGRGPRRWRAGRRSRLPRGRAQRQQAPGPPGWHLRRFSVGAHRPPYSALSAGQLMGSLSRPHW
jgi:hypothetical protein